MVRRLLFVAAAILLVGISLTACQSKRVSRVTCPAGKLCLEYGNGADPNTLDPQLAQAVNESAILRELFQGMVTDGPDGGPVPGLAKSWEVSPDGLVWTFHMRPALWSDGVPVTARDFVYAYRRMLDPKTGSAYAYLLYVIKNAQPLNSGHASPDSLGVRALDDETLQLTLEHPASYLPQLLKHQAFYPLPQHAVEKWGARWVDPSHYVSNGPYVLKIWRLSDYVRIEKNPRFEGADKVCFDVVDFYPTADPISAERRVLRGELDVNNSITANRVPHLRADPISAKFVHTHTYLNTLYLAFNRRDVPALKDVRVRQAISMAIDRDFITQKILRAGQIPAYGFVPPGIAGYLPKGARWPAPYWATWTLAQREDEARRLMAAAGYGPGNRLRLQLKTTIGQGTPVAAQSIQADLKGIGIDIDFRQEDGIVVFESFNIRDFQLGLAGWVADYDDPMTYLGLMKSDTGQQNFGDYNNPAYDALLNAADNEPDAGKRAADLARAEQLMLNDADIAPLFTSVNLNLVNPHITGWVDNDADVHPISDLCRNDAPAKAIKPAA